jgi:hypothetical protein
MRSARKLGIICEIFRSIPKSLHANVGVLIQNGHYFYILKPSLFFIHNHLITLYKTPFT